MHDKQLNILLVEDDDVAAEVVVRSMKKQGVDFPIIHATDGQDALNILRARDGCERIRRPYVILLDLNMPRMNGFEFLDVLRSDEALGGSVVFVLTTSNADADRTRAYHQHIAGYMVKSQVGPQFAKVANLFREYQPAISF